MATREDQRRERRVLHDHTFYAVWATPNAGEETKGKTVNVSKRGFAFRSWRRWPVGAILWCALPGLGVYSRARVCHCSGGLRRTTGVEFMATHPPSDL
jgi:hypothetical protein